MPRPVKERLVHRPPAFADFKPAGVRGRGLAVQPLALDEFEAIRLADYEGLEHAEAAGRMGISRSTFTRLIERARANVARFLVEGRRLQIEGGEVHFHGNLLRCGACGHLVEAELADAEPTGAPGACPACGADELDDLAGGFGHGRCCRRRGRRAGRT
jgi:predicted DNA-binding protein (UPF0251 family)